MTVVVALAGAEGIVLASDSQMSAGATKREEQKVWGVPGAGFAFGLAGIETSMHLLRDALLNHTLTGDPTRDAAGLAALADSVLGPEYQKCVALTGGIVDWSRMPAAWAIVGSYDSLGLPHVYAIDYLARVTDHARGFAAIGTGSDHAEQVRAVFRSFNGPALSLHQTKMLAFRIVQDAIEIAGPAVAIGRPIQMATVETGGVSLLARDDHSMVYAVANWMQDEAARIGDHVPPG